MIGEYNKALLNFLLPMVNEKRLRVLQEMLDKRTRYVTVVLEDIYQPQNASAVLRTCDCFGIQDVHIIENRNTYEINPEVELGAAQWLTRYTYNEKENNTLQAITKLRQDGYRIIATSPHTKQVSLEDFDLLKGKAAILFGTEISGLSTIALENADEYLSIPMMGFTESFNISVSAGIVLHQLSLLLRRSSVDWSLEDEEREIIYLEWVQNSIKNADRIVNGFKKKYYL